VPEIQARGLDGDDDLARCRYWSRGRPQLEPIERASPSDLQPYGPGLAARRMGGARQSGDVPARLPQCHANLAVRTRAEFVDDLLHITGRPRRIEIEVPRVQFRVLERDGAQEAVERRLQEPVAIHAAAQRDGPA